MIFIKNLTKITETKYSIGFIHYCPFDLKNGLKKSEEELKEEGYLICNIPKKEKARQELYFNPKTETVFWDYAEKEEVSSEESLSLEKLNQRVDIIGTLITKEKINNTQKDKIIEQFGKEITMLKIQNFQK